MIIARNNFSKSNAIDYHLTATSRRKKKRQADLSLSITIGVKLLAFVERLTNIHLLFVLPLLILVCHHPDAFSRSLAKPFARVLPKPCPFVFSS